MGEMAGRPYGPLADEKKRTKKMFVSLSHQPELDKNVQKPKREIARSGETIPYLSNLQVPRLNAQS